MLKIRENIDIDTVAAICAGSLETLQICNDADNPRELFGVELYFLTRVCSFCTYLKVLVIDNASIKAEDMVLLCQKLVNRHGASRHFTLHIDPKNIKVNFQGKKSSKKYKEWMRINMTATTVKQVSTGRTLKVFDRGDCARQRRRRGHTGQQFPQSL